MEDFSHDQVVSAARWVWIVVLASLIALLGIIGLGIHWGNRPGYEEGLVLGSDRLELYGKDITWQSFCSELKLYIESGRISLIVRTEPEASQQLSEKARTVALECGAKEVYVQPVADAVAGPSVLNLTEKVSDICQTHHTRMIRELVPVHYGLIIDDEDTKLQFQRSRKEFPNARTAHRGGCIIGKERQAIVYVCRKCRAARRNFVLANTGNHQKS
jgi:hypothetical protein